MLLLCPVYNDLRETLFTTLVHEFPDIDSRTDRERLCAFFLPVRKTGVYEHVPKPVLKFFSSAFRFRSGLNIIAFYNIMQICSNLTEGR